MVAWSARCQSMDADAQRNRGQAGCSAASIHPAAECCQTCFAGCASSGIRSQALPIATPATMSRTRPDTWWPNTARDPLPTATDVETSDPGTCCPPLPSAGSGWRDALSAARSDIGHDQRRVRGRLQQHRAAIRADADRFIQRFGISRRHPQSAFTPHGSRKCSSPVVPP